MILQDTTIDRLPLLNTPQMLVMFQRGKRIPRYPIGALGDKRNTLLGRTSLKFRTMNG
ncbi:Uncharacterised protein [Serratia quinivorans]|nr:Uncharacterised protein [Serratia quinivorans]